MPGEANPAVAPRERGPLPPQQPESGIVPCSLRQFFGYFLRLGTFGFGGPTPFRESRRSKT